MENERIIEVSFDKYDKGLGVVGSSFVLGKEVDAVEPTAVAASSPTWSPEQETVFCKYLSGENIFITGPGGTGKTAIIRRIYEHAVGHMKTIAVCALTGCAAQLLNCHARTIHSWAGIGLGTGTIKDYVSKIFINGQKKKNWQTTQILVIDEVSMMSKKVFDLLNGIGKIIRRRRDLPFGGIQIIMSGDFYQLPPVWGAGAGEDPEMGQFCFESAEWGTIFGPQNTVILHTMFRQLDAEYAGILNEIREGVIKKRSILRLAAQVGKSRSDEMFIEPTKLFPRRDQVETVNFYHLAQLGGEEHVFQVGHVIPGVRGMGARTGELHLRDALPKNITMEDVKQEIANMEASVLCDVELKLKVGTQVMCIVNAEFPIYMGDYRGLVRLYNGCQGVITQFHPVEGVPIVRFYTYPTVEIAMTAHTWESERIRGLFIRQIPLLHSWAITIHKAQGVSLDYAEIDIGSSIFEDGQTYVALSRVRTLEGLYLSAFDYTKIRVNKRVQEFYRKLREKV